MERKMDKEIRLYEHTDKFLEFATTQTDCILASMYSTKKDNIDKIVNDMERGGLIPLAILADIQARIPFRVLLKRGK
jgi:hypothetical protein